MPLSRVLGQFLPAHPLFDQSLGRHDTFQEAVQCAVFTVHCAVVRHQWQQQEMGVMKAATTGLRWSMCVVMINVLSITIGVQ